MSVNDRRLDWLFDTGPHPSRFTRGLVSVVIGEAILARSFTIHFFVKSRHFIIVMLSHIYTV